MLETSKYTNDKINSIKKSSFATKAKNKTQSTDTDSKGKLEKSEDSKWDFVLTHRLLNFEDVLSVFNMIKDIKEVKKQIDLDKNIKLLVKDEESGKHLTFTISSDKNKEYCFRETAFES